MDRIAHIRRLFASFLHSAAVLRVADPRTLDELARAHFLEGVAGVRFNSVAGHGRPSAAIAKLLVLISPDPTIDPVRTPWASEWMKPAMVYKRAWEAANRVVAAKGLNGEDVLQRSLMDGLATGKGNYFYLAGKQFKAEGLVSGQVTPEDAGGRAAAYAINGAKNLLKRETSRKRYETESAGDDEVFELGTVTPKNWDSVIEYVYTEPTSPFSQDFFSWLKGLMGVIKFTAGEKAAFAPYLDMIIAGNAPSDEDYAGSIGMARPQFSAVKKKFRDESFKLFQRNPPAFLRDADDQITFMNVAQGKVAMARNITAAEKALRSKIIRLAHSNPELRPHLIPLLKQADAEPSAEQIASEIMAGRPWGGKGYKPKAKDYDDPSPGPGSPPCQPDGEGGCYEHTDMYKGYGKSNSGSNGSAARRQYNKKYREMLGL
jgi:hypothetical protein